MPSVQLFGSALYGRHPSSWTYLRLAPRGFSAPLQITNRKRARWCNPKATGRPSRLFSGNQLMSRCLVGGEGQALIPDGKRGVALFVTVADSVSKAQAI